MIPKSLLRQQRAQSTAQVHSTPSPIGGWNARDSIDQMAETDAVVLDNWFPDEGDCAVRKGFTELVNGLGGNVEMLAEYHSGATQKFLAAANGKFFDITSAGTATQIGSAFSSNRWQFLNFNGQIGFVNGTDHPQKYAGSAVSSMTISASAVGTVASFIGIQSFKSRTYFWTDSSQDFYYSGINALGGTLTRFPLSRVCQTGGKLITIQTWSRDAGDGMDDIIIFIMSTGELIAYQGSNPADASDWALVGVYKLGLPVSIRGAVKYGGDVVVITDLGYFPVSSAFQGVNLQSAISDKISKAVRTAVSNYKSNYGWQAIYYPNGHWLVFNIPVTTNITYHQHVMNTITGAWCRFTGMNARCWGMYNGDLYFGGNGSVYQANSGASDNSSDIEAIGQPAYTYLGNRAKRKVMSALQPVFSTDGNLNFSLSLGTDFSTPSTLSPQRSAEAAGATWGTAVWNTAEWAGGLSIINDWRITPGIGYNVSPRLAITVNGLDVRWYSTQYMYKDAGII